MVENNYSLEFVNILKVYPNGVVANKNVNLKVNRGEIHALIGENGAGKSTLMKILFGIENPDEGKIFINGKEVNINNPNEAINYGIGMVHQHFMLVDSLSIAENIFLGYEPKKNKVFLDTKKMIELSWEYAKKYNFNIDVTSKISDVSVGVRQETEILKALARGAEILILDEPTAVLTPQETKQLFIELKTLKEEGHTIIFISHKLDEVVEICDRITIMRNGTTIETTSLEGITPQEISNKMVGREVILKIEKEKHDFGNKILSLENISYNDRFNKEILKDISFSIRKGEIVSIAGVEGNGQAEIAKIIAGIIKPDKGQLNIDGERLIDNSVISHRNKGIVYIPQDRMSVGCNLNMTIYENLIATNIDRYIKNKLFLNFEKIYSDSDKLVDEFRIKCVSSNQKVKMLSGGNMQKVVAARELSGEIKLVLAEQPTRGIDPGAAELIRKRLIMLRDKGVGILLISADLNEILELSDSCIVMYNGEISALFNNTENLTEEELGYYMLGIKKMKDKMGDI